MPYPQSTPVTAGQTGTITQYNNLRDDALFPIYQSFTYGETIAVNDALYLKASDGKVYKTSASYNDERIYNFIGFAKEAGALNDVKKVQIGGKVEGFSGLTIGSFYYLSNTAGAVETAEGTYRKIIGLAISATELVIVKGIEMYNIVASDTLRASADTERYTSGDDTEWYLMKRIVVEANGSIRTKFDLRRSASYGTDSYGQIRINGAPAGTVRRGSTYYQTFTEDINVNAYDQIEVWTAAGGAGADYRAVTNNFRIYYDKTTYSNYPSVKKD